jgi:hypothetical protein
MIRVHDPTRGATSTSIVQTIVAFGSPCDASRRFGRGVCEDDS